MRKEIMLVGLVLLIGISYGITFDVKAPEYVAPNSNVSTQLVMQGSADVVDVGIVVPKGITLNSWDIYGLPKSNVNYTVEEVYGKTMYHFKINNVDKQSTLVTYFKVTSSGKLDYVITYKYGNFTSMAYKSSYIKLKEAVCGNGICEPGETPYNCPTDCSINEKTNYLLITVIAILAVSGLGYWIYRKHKLKE